MSRKRYRQRNILKKSRLFIMLSSNDRGLGTRASAGQTVDSPVRRKPARSGVPAAVSLERSRLMASVRQRGTAPELVVRRLARAAGVMVQANGTALPGSPDLFSLTPPRAVFVHGCFWHRHPGCKAATTPRSHRHFWTEKFVANLRRDRRKLRQLRALGFRVMTVWECQVRRTKNLDRVINRLVRFFESGRTR